MQLIDVYQGLKQGYVFWHYNPATLKKTELLGDGILYVEYRGGVYAGAHSIKRLLEMDYPTDGWILSPPSIFKVKPNFPHEIQQYFGVGDDEFRDFWGSLTDLSYYQYVDLETGKFGKPGRDDL